ncbi:hypothetical protein KIL84_007263 [Mauremys mutica]|uniref:Uncharacterized protein n=1 Tax=Mauremys mutica TaxID=74926 RepID=A0A9D4AWX4_9SAUR|nr:hypothetical protein KIL84_007263 [Mauremys mutica]
MLIEELRICGVHTATCGKRIIKMQINISMLVGIMMLPKEGLAVNGQQKLLVMLGKVGRVALVAEEQKTHVKTRRQMHGAEVEETQTATDQRAFPRNTNAVCNTLQWFNFSTSCAKPQ